MRTHSSMMDNLVTRPSHDRPHYALLVFSALACNSRTESHRYVPVVQMWL